MPQIFHVPTFLKEHPFRCFEVAVDCFWKYLTDFENIWLNLGNDWLILWISGLLWEYLANFGNIWLIYIYIVFDWLCENLVDFETIWLILGIIYWYREYLASFQNIWLILRILWFLPVVWCLADLETWKTCGLPSNLSSNTFHFHCVRLFWLSDWIKSFRQTTFLLFLQ